MADDSYVDYNVYINVHMFSCLICFRYDAVYESKYSRIIVYTIDAIDPKYSANVASHLNLNMIAYRQFIIIYGP